MRQAWLLLSLLALAVPVLGIGELDPEPSRLSLAGQAQDQADCRIQHQHGGPFLGIEGEEAYLGATVVQLQCGLGV